MLGHQKHTRDEDLDQDFPLDINDDFIAEEGVLPVPAVFFWEYGSRQRGHEIGRNNGKCY